MKVESIKYECRVDNYMKGGGLHSFTLRDDDREKFLAKKKECISRYKDRSECLKFGPTIRVTRESESNISEAILTVDRISNLYLKQNIQFFKNIRKHK